MRHTNCTHESTPAGRRACRASQVSNYSSPYFRGRAPELPFAEAVAACRAAIARDGYGVAYVELPELLEDHDDDYASIKIFEIDADGNVFGKVYSGCEINFNLRDCRSFKA